MNFEQERESKLDDEDLRLLMELVDRIYMNGYRDGFDKAHTVTRIEDIVRILKNSGQDIYARKFLEASNLELVLANKEIDLATAHRIELEKALEAAEDARRGNRMRDWQWI